MAEPRTDIGPVIIGLVAGLVLLLFHLDAVRFEEMVGWELFIIALGVWRLVRDVRP